MPIYEFDCLACGKRFSDLLAIGAGNPRCPACSSHLVSKRVSRVQRARSESDRLDAIADRLEGMGDPTDSGMESTLRELGKALDEDVSEELGAAFDSGDFDD